MLRYALLYLKGGIYTDTDTSLLKNIADWGEDPDLYRQGRGWLFPEDREGEPTEEEKTELKRGLKRASVIVGIESDVGDREDWHDWWPRPVSRLWERSRKENHNDTDSNFTLYAAPDRSVDPGIGSSSPHLPRHAAGHHAINRRSVRMGTRSTSHTSPSSCRRRQSCR